MAAVEPAKITEKTGTRDTAEMAETSNALLSSLESKGQVELLNDIDRLRSQGLGHFEVSLPQIIVCGDQSSGKSSVLEALSRVQFPTKDELCTRFATEVILRKAPTARASVTIIPGISRTSEERQRLLSFKSPHSNLEQFSSLVEVAQTEILSAKASAFSDDVLRVEIYGPNLPQLTIVDLPGIIHSESKQQTEADVRLVSKLVKGYMENQRSIILTVVTAKNDISNQIVLKMAREVDPNGSRTLGVITKPDTLHAGSNSELKFVELAKNENIKFHLGWHLAIWHAVRNRDFNTKDVSAEARDEAESQFFAQGIWKSLPRNTVGINSLRGRLSRVLLEHITRELPALIEDIEKGLEDCRVRLSRLGESRTTLKEQRLFLIRTSQRFQLLVKAAADGDYSDSFFGKDSSGVGYSKRLRAVIQNLNTEFSALMAKNGHRVEIQKDSDNKIEPSMPSAFGNTTEPSRPYPFGNNIEPSGTSVFDNKIEPSGPSIFGNKIGPSRPPLFGNKIEPSGPILFKEGLPISTREPKKVAWSKYISLVSGMMKRNRGRELPGTFNPLLISDLFFNQAEPWQQLAQEHIQQAWEASRTTLELALSTIVDEETSAALQAQVVDAIMREKLSELNNRLEQILKPHQKGHAITYNNYFTEVIQKARLERQEKDLSQRFYAYFNMKQDNPPEEIDIKTKVSVPKLMSSLINQTEADMDLYACSEVIECMQAYYKVALKVFVDNVACLAIENCLMEGLREILSPSQILDMDDSLVTAIAAEPEEAQNERLLLTEKQKVLEAGLQTCKRYVRRRATGNQKAEPGSGFKGIPATNSGTNTNVFGSFTNKTGDLYITSDFPKWFSKDTPLGGPTTSLMSLTSGSTDENSNPNTGGSFHDSLTPFTQPAKNGNTHGAKAKASWRTSPLPRKEFSVPTTPFSIATPSITNPGSSLANMTPYKEYTNEFGYNEVKSFQTINSYYPHVHFSFEEIRLDDYLKGKRFASAGLAE